MSIADDKVIAFCVCRKTAGSMQVAAVGLAKKRSLTSIISLMVNKEEKQGCHIISNFIPAIQSV